MALALLPPNTVWIVESFLYDPEDYDPEDSGALCALGRVAIAAGNAILLAKAKGAFDDLWARREALQLEEFLWSAGNSPRSAGWDSYGYWSDGDFAIDDEWQWDYN